MSEDDRIENNSFSIKLDGVRAVILFPSLVTPCLVDKTGKMLVIIAVQEDSFSKLKELTSEKIKEEEEVPVEVAVKLHSHMYLVPWGKNYADAPAAGYISEEMYRSHLQDVTGNANLIYLSHTLAEEKYRDSKKPFRVWYLGELSKKLVSPLYIKTKEGGKVPFGQIEPSARALYKDSNYTHIFQLEFSDFPTAKQLIQDPSAKGLYELLWACGDSAGVFKKSYAYEKPGDTLLLKNYEESLNKTGKTKLLDPNVLTAPRKALKKGWILSEIEDVNMYRLLNPGKKAFTKKRYPNGYPTEILNALPAMTQVGAHLFFSRHPVFICGKEHLDIGVIGDLHISSRQAAYKLTNCQVIPGADIEDSPYIGQMSNEFLLSARDVMDKVAKSCDMLVIAGDIVDHSKNLYLKKCAKKINKTGRLWEYVKYKEKGDELYPKRIDGIMMLELILQCYDANKLPVFFVTGNHEGYRVPYGISPRVPVVGRVNEGIPCDHNLNIYEAALLYGETYDDCKWFNFEDETLEWYFQMFSPWEDVLVTHGKYNFIFLCWGKDEGYVKSTLEGGKTLPRSYGPITDKQLKILAYAGSQADDKKNVLISHFTYIAYDPLLPLKNVRGGPNAGLITIGESRLSKTGGVISAAGVVFKPLAPYALALGAGVGFMGEKESAFCETNLGSFTENLHKMFSLLSSGSIQYTVSGHAHRGCVYAITGQAAQGREWAMLAVRVFSEQYLSLAWDAITLDKVAAKTSVPVAPVLSSDALFPEAFSLPAGQTACIVTGSAGPVGVQNMEGEFGGLGLDKPQGMVFSPGNRQVRVVRASGPKPRLASVAGALQDIGRVFPFKDESRWWESSKRTDTGTTWWNKYFYIHLNKKWMTIFDGCPFDMLRVHAVFNNNGTPDADSFNLSVKAVDKQEIQFHQSAKDFDEFYNSRKKHAGNSAIAFFMSIHFSGTFVEKNNKYLSLYDLSPWSFPITLDRKWTLISWDRPCLTYTEQELPVFKYYEQFNEYAR